MLNIAAFCQNIYLYGNVGAYLVVCTWLYESANALGLLRELPTVALHVCAQHLPSELRSVRALF